MQLQFWIIYIYELFVKFMLFMSMHFLKVFKEHGEIGLYVGLYIINIIKGSINIYAVSILLTLYIVHKLRNS